MVHVNEMFQQIIYYYLTGKLTLMMSIMRPQGQNFIHTINEEVDILMRASLQDLATLAQNQQLTAQIWSAQSLLESREDSTLQQPNILTGFEVKTIKG